MQRMKDIIIKYKTYFLAFSLSFFAVCAGFVCFGIFPFGDESILTVDMSQQYIQFFSEFRHIIYNGKSLLYSFDTGMGLNFFGFITYYLMSPFNLIVLIFPEDYIVEAVTLIIILKISASALTFNFFARKVLNADNTGSVIFSLLYSMMSWSTVFFSNIMWHDALIILPLLIFSLHRIVYYNKLKYFICALTYIFIVQYYMAYIIGLFSFLTFICFSVLKFHRNEIKIAAKRFALFCIGTAVAFGLSAFTILPSYFILSDSMELLGQSLPGFEICFSPVKMLQTLFSGSFSGLLSNKYPNLFCGVLTVILLPSYFFCKQISKREKCIAGALIGFMVINMLLLPTNIIWQCFDDPNGFYGRYTLVISFILVVLSCRAFSFIRNIDFRVVISTVCGVIVYLAISCFVFKDGLLTGSAYAVNFILAAGIAIVLYLMCKNFSRILKLALIALCLFDVIFNFATVLNRIDSNEEIYPRSGYVSNAKRLRATTQNLYKSDDSFFRIEKDFGRDRNDPLAGHYHGISHYSSVTSVKLNSTLSKLGYNVQNYYKMWVEHRGATKLTDAVLGVKYYLHRNVDGEYYSVSQNQLALPLAYTVDRGILSYSPDSVNPLENQDALLKIMLGDKNANVFEAVNYEVVLNNAVLNDNTCSQIDNTQKADVEYVFSQEIPDYVFIKWAEDYKNNIEVTINGNKITNTLLVLDMSLYKTENAVTSVKIEFDGNVSFEPFFVILNEEKAENYLSKLTETKVDVDMQSERHIILHCSTNEEEVIFTSIPYDKGWHCKVNGKSVDIIPLLGDSFIGINVDAGENEIVMTFISRGLIPGFLLSLSTAIILILIRFLLKKSFYASK